MDNDESCANCIALQEELELCKAKAAQELERLQEEIDEERKKNNKEREVIERKMLKLNNELSDARRKLENRPTTKSVEKQSQPTDVHHPYTTGSSIVATSVNNAVGMYSLQLQLSSIDRYNRKY